MQTATIFPYIGAKDHGLSHTWMRRRGSDESNLSVSFNVQCECTVALMVAGWASRKQSSVKRKRQNSQQGHFRCTQPLSIHLVFPSGKHTFGPQLEAAPDNGVQKYLNRFYVLLSNSQTWLDSIFRKTLLIILLLCDHQMVLFSRVHESAHMWGKVFVSHSLLC